MIEKVVILDAAQISTIWSHTGEAGLDAVLSRGDYFFFSDDCLDELLRSGNWYKKNGVRFNAWLERKGNQVIGVAPVKPEEESIYDPNDKRKTTRGGAEKWDMSARKFMAQNPQFEFEVISRDKDFFENKSKKRWNPQAKRHEKIVDVEFNYTSIKKLMSELIVDPNLHLAEEQIMNK